MNDLKRCSKCTEVKPRAEFHKHRRTADGLRGECKSCVLVWSRKWKRANPEKERAIQRKYREKNPEKRYESKRRWRTDNHDLVLESNARRRSLKRNAEQATCPRERAAIRAMYALAPLVSWLLGEEVAVDHRVPLAAGGTNRLDNLCFLPARINAMKGAKLDHEWDGELLAYLVVNNHT